VVFNPTSYILQEKAQKQQNLGFIGICSFAKMPAAVSRALDL
jgi:hypothetical protein